MVQSRNVSEPPKQDIQPEIVLTKGTADTTKQANHNDLFGCRVVATVNGSPILASEVLERYGVQLIQASQQLPPDKFDQVRETLIKRDLKGHIERQLLVSSLKEMLKPEQVKMLNSHLDQMFEQHLLKLKAEIGVETNHDLEEVLQKQGTSLGDLKTGFTNQQMAMEFLGMRAEKAQTAITRPDLLKYYEAHIKDYDQPARVKWQQIYLSHAKNGGKQGSDRVLTQVIAELKQGTDFAAVAKKHSNGPTADEGGTWDWTAKGSLANEKIERALFELPEGTISQVMEDSDAVQLVKVIKRRDAGPVSFEKVQNNIREKLVKEQRAEAARTVFDELMEQAVIETFFDATAENEVQEVEQEVNTVQSVEAIEAPEAKVETIEFRQITD